MRYPKLRELKEAIVSLVTPPATTKFPYKPHVPAPAFRGKPVVNDAECVGCHTCSNVCPSGAITVSDDAVQKIRTITRDFGKCIFCGQCEAYCITAKGVILSHTIFDLSTFQKESLIEQQHKELIVCEHCGSVITTREHLHYIYDKLGTRAWSSLLTLRALNTRLQLAGEEETSTPPGDGLRRKDMFRILCPNCMRNIQIKLLL